MLALIELGLNHEQQHQELILTDIKHALWSNPLRPAYRAQPMERRSTGTRVADRADTQVARWQEFEGGIHSIGHAGEGFAFDNEGPRHEVLLRPFRIALARGHQWRVAGVHGRRRISQRPELWLSDGWDTVCAQQWEAPLYWERRDDELVAVHAERHRRVEASEPVCHVSYYEADAYARWAGARLPTGRGVGDRGREESESRNHAGG